jgi:hypothetical protein
MQQQLRLAGVFCNGVWALLPTNFAGLLQVYGLL